MQSRIGYISLKSIQISPDYVENRKKKTFFHDTSTGPSYFLRYIHKSWPSMGPICNALQIMHSKHMKKTNENTEENIDSIIRKHPLTCTCYYRNKFNALLKFLKKRITFLGMSLTIYLIQNSKTKVMNMTMGSCG